jgi:hypothetical protein
MRNDNAMADRLGILVHSDRHPEFVLQLARAAKERGKQVCIHFTGPGLQLAAGPLIEALAGLARISVEQKAPAEAGFVDSVAMHRIPMSEFFKACDRTVVF